MSARYDIAALGELLIDFTDSGVSPGGMRLFERNPGGAPANVLTAAARFGQRDNLRLRPRQSRSGIQHAAQRLRGRTERLFHKKSSKCPTTPGLLWLRRGAAGIHIKRQVKKEAEAS